MPYSFWLFLIIFFSILLYAPFAINKTLKNFINDEPDQIVNQENFSNDDPKQIVIDEVLGMFIPLLFLSLAFQMQDLPKILQNLGAPHLHNIQMLTNLDVAKPTACYKFG